MSDQAPAEPFTDSTLGEHAASIAAARQPYLGDIVVVESLIRDFVSGVVGRYGEFAMGQITQAQALAGNDLAVQDTVVRLTGSDPTYYPIDGWTGEADGQLASIAAVMTPIAPLFVANEGPAMAAAGYVLAQIYQAIGAFNNSGAEQDYRDTLQAVVAEGVRIFMGQPSEIAFVPMVPEQQAV